ncbi:hypothetical protein BAUCODRAFT_235633 [Baudoinia panamericana UAMH 10762]|uniref:Uncharacterized protein n=1 Tax=Baudoinia panamericana (strain UAMH 10762) TaxID=717646 RepID=M2N3I1_BAUPA|nr:uncharacterized protein BAUCODRAFT_235633 [Baudoinia panamericana UAMH 10762]EMC93290.1 hypothetical protein BAUCODRAFT_235633 [Baudoinia panamericana UAMH 10762]
MLAFSIGGEDCSQACTGITCPLSFQHLSGRSGITLSAPSQVRYCCLYAHLQQRCGVSSLDETVRLLTLQHSSRATRNSRPGSRAALRSICVAVFVLEAFIGAACRCA